MSFSPITSELSIRKIVVYDLEWIPVSLKLRMCGFYDGRRYHAYSTVAGLMNRLLSKENRGAYIYAHAGGLADMLFLLEHLGKTSEYRVEASFSGSSAVVVRVSKNRDVWVFVDSYWLLRDKLEHLAHSLGKSKERDAFKCVGYPACGHVGRECKQAPKCGCKVGPEPLCMFYAAPMKILCEYNERDCKILYEAIDRFQKSLLLLGTDLQLTIASTAMRHFRRNYLKSPIETSSSLSDLVRPAYIASRVEPYREYGENLTLYDINSSFPYAMTFPTPGRLLGRSTKIPTDPNILYVATCDVVVPDMFLPPLGRRAKRDGRIYFPTGKWNGMFSRPDLELLLEVGGRIEKVTDVMLFEARTDFADYARHLYEKRRKETDQFMRLLYKYLLNSCYGKTAESRDKTKLMLHPFSLACPHDGLHDHVDASGCMVSKCVEELFPGAILISEEKTIAHEHVPIAMQITSEARRTLYHCAVPCGEDLYYSDTDSLYTHHVFEDSDKLGGLKREKTVKKAHFSAPKLYKTDGEVKGKGFSHITEAQYDGLQVGQPIQIERMLRVKEMSKRMGGIYPLSATLEKRLNLGGTRPKRNMRGGEASSPWHVREIEEKWKIKVET